MTRMAVWAGIALPATVYAQELRDPVVLVVDVENFTVYRGDTFETVSLASSPGPTTSTARTFLATFGMADIVAVNGKAAKGLWNYLAPATPFNVNPVPGQPIADLNGSGIFQMQWHILQPDGTYIGSLTERGQDAAPGTFIVVGGAGAFFGVIGERRIIEGGPARVASTSEDPSMRRVHGGGRNRHRFVLYPRFRPEVMTTASGPAVFHADSSQVTAVNPARAGETLVVRATGLGPTKPDLDPPGLRPFAANPLEEVNSPVVVTVNGIDAEVINKVGWPGEINVYRVDFKVPNNPALGTVRLRLATAWVPGSEVTIPVR